MIDPIRKYRDAILIGVVAFVMTTSCLIGLSCGLDNDRATIQDGGTVDQRTASPDLDADVLSDRSSATVAPRTTSGPATAELDDRVASPDIATDKSRRTVAQKVGDGGSANATDQNQFGVFNLAIGGGGILALGVWLFHIRYSNGRLYAFVLNLLRVERGLRPTMDPDKALPEDRPPPDPDGPT